MGCVGFKITAQATTGPASGPRPASSTPASMGVVGSMGVDMLMLWPSMRESYYCNLTILDAALVADKSG